MRLQQSNQPNEIDMDLMERETVEICEVVQKALDAEEQAKAAIRYLIHTKVLAGVRLAAKRDQLEHGQWLGWVENNLPISDQTARNWIKLAHFARIRGDELENASNMRQAYQLAGLLPESEGSGGNSASKGESYLAHLTRSAAQISAEIARTPIDEWPSHKLQSLKERIKPLIELYAQLEEAESV
jgi:hypothetical protein